ncbi:MULTISPECIES: ribbon-helix-helix protein, CopG family [unclassified Anabaena]|nr:MULTISPECIES: ribbon-helix-helix protein, CopG family [unclassified Anabaena]
MKKKSLPVYLDEVEKEKLEKIAANWGVSLSSAVKRLIREKDV